VQCYLAPADAAADAATVTLRRRAFEVWDPARRGWVVPEQDLLLHLGRSVEDLRLTVPLPGTRLTTVDGQPG